MPLRGSFRRRAEPSQNNMRRRGRIDALMRRYQGAVPGAALSVLRDGVPVLRRAYGLANVEDRVAATAAPDPAVQYGFGWRVSGATLWHSGESTGFRNVIVRYPQERVTVIVLTNRSHPEPYATALTVAELFLRASV